MAPIIPTHRPVLTATRVAMSIAAFASASSLYLALGSSWAVTGLSAQVPNDAVICPVASIEPAPSAQP